MANIVGSGGCVKNDAAVVTGIKTWSLDWTMDVFDVTEMADTAPTAHAIMTGLYSWSGSFVGNHTDGAAPLTPGTSYTLNLETDGTDKYSGTAFITGKSVSIDVTGEATTTWNFQGNGAITATLS